MKDWTKEIKRSELYIKIERVSIMRYKCWNKAQEYYKTHGTYPAWDDFQTERLSRIFKIIMNKIEQLKN